MGHGSAQEAEATNRFPQYLNKGNVYEGAQCTRGDGVHAHAHASLSTPPYSYEVVGCIPYPRQSACELCVRPRQTRRLALQAQWHACSPFQTRKRRAHPCTRGDDVRAYADASLSTRPWTREGRLVHPIPTPLRARASYAIVEDAATGVRALPDAADGVHGLPDAETGVFVPLDEVAGVCAPTNWARQRTA